MPPLDGTAYRVQSVHHLPCTTWVILKEDFFRTFLRIGRRMSKKLANVSFSKGFEKFHFFLYGKTEQF